MTMDPHQKEGLKSLWKKLRKEKDAAKTLLDCNMVNGHRKRQIEGQMYGLNSCLTILSAIIMDDGITQEEISNDAKL